MRESCAVQFCLLTHRERNDEVSARLPSRRTGSGRSFNVPADCWRRPGGDQLGSISSGAAAEESQRDDSSDMWRSNHWRSSLLDEIGTISGYGNTCDDCPASLLLKVAQNKVLPKEVCSKIFGTIALPTATQICVSTAETSGNRQHSQVGFVRSLNGHEIFPGNPLPMTAGARRQTS